MCQQICEVCWQTPTEGHRVLYLPQQGHMRVIAFQLKGVMQQGMQHRPNRPIARFKLTAISCPSLLVLFTLLDIPPDLSKLCLPSSNPRITQATKLQSAQQQCMHCTVNILTANGSGLYLSIVLPPLSDVTGSPPPVPQITVLNAVVFEIVGLLCHNKSIISYSIDKQIQDCSLLEASTVATHQHRP